MSGAAMQRVTQPPAEYFCQFSRKIRLLLASNNLIGDMTNDELSDIVKTDRSHLHQTLRAHPDWGVLGMMWVFLLGSSWVPALVVRLAGPPWCSDTDSRKLLHDANERRTHLEENND